MAHAPSLDDAAALADTGQWAAARRAYAEALAHDELPEAHLGAARASWWLADLRPALDHGERAFAGLAARGRDAEAAMVGVHLCIWHLTNFDNPAAAEGWLARASTLAARSGDAAAQGWVTLVSGYLHGDHAEGRRMIEAAAATGETLADRDLSTMALADLGLLHVTAGEVERGLRMLDEALATSFALPRPMLEVVVWSSCNMLAACSLVDDLQRATRWCRAADRFSETYGCPFLQARCRAHYGRVLVAAGRWDEAEAQLEQALSMTADTGRGPRTEALTALAELRQRQGSPAVALELLRAADGSAVASAIRAAALVELGEVDEARAVLRAELVVQPADSPDRPLLAAATAETALAAGDTEEAERVLRLDTGSAAPAYPRGGGLLTRAAGLVAAAAGDPDAAREKLARALDTFTTLELPFEAARTELDLARLLQEADPQAATGLARAAYTRLQRLGARRQADAAADLLRSLGVTPPPGPRQPGALSAREQDVLALLAEGLSNPDIGARLYLSPRTVGHHVSSILRKLEVHSRAEAAAYAARTGIQR